MERLAMRGKCESAV
jgi:hypothetical protein